MSQCFVHRRLLKKDTSIKYQENGTNEHKYATGRLRPMIICSVPYFCLSVFIIIQNVPFFMQDLRCSFPSETREPAPIMACSVWEYTL